MAPTLDEELETQAAREVAQAAQQAGFSNDDDGPDDDQAPGPEVDAVPHYAMAIESGLGSAHGGGGGSSGLNWLEQEALRQGAKRLFRKEVETALEKGIEQQVEKSLFRKAVEWGVEKTGWEAGKNLLRRFGWGAAEKAAEGAGETALEGTVAGAGETAVVTGEAVAGAGETAAVTGEVVAGTAVAVPVAIGVAIGTAVSAPFAYVAYKADKELRTQLNEQSKARRREIAGVPSQETRIGRYDGLTSTLISTLPQMQNNGQLDVFHSGFATNLHLTDNTLTDNKGHALNVSDPKVLNEFQGIIDQNIAAQEKIRNANDNKYLPDWMRIFSHDSVQKKENAEVALAPLYRARAELDQYRHDIAAHPPAPAATLPTLAAARPHGHDYSNLQIGNSATYVVGDSIAMGAGNCLAGNVVNLAVEKSHITTQSGLTGAREQLDYVMSHYHAGDKLFLHTGWNDAGSANSTAYRKNLELMASQAQFLKEHGVEIVWVAPSATSNEHSKQVKPEMRAQVEAMARVHTEVAAAHGIKVINKLATCMSNDGIHPNSQDQYAAWARDVTQGTGLNVGPGYHFAPSQQMVASNAPPPPSPGHKLVHERSAALADQLELHKLEQKYELPAGLMLAVMDTECRGDPQIVNGQRLSARGACGAFQFMPATAHQYGVDPKDPHQSADGAARMLSSLNKKYHGDVAKIAAAYNWGTGNVDTKGLDNAPLETQNYIKWVKSKMGIGEPPTPIEIASAARVARRMSNRDNPALALHGTPHSHIEVAQNDPERHTLKPHAALAHENAG